MDQQITELCENCFKSFPQSKMATHFGYCRRNIKKCDKCQQMYDINFLQDHQQEFHKLAKCSYCKQQFQPNDIIKHQDNCQAKTRFCQYCDLDVPTKQYGMHVKACEARTKPCEKCKKPISNKQYLVHLVSCSGYVEQSISQSSSNKYNNYNEYIQNKMQNQKIHKGELKQQVVNKYAQKKQQKRPQYSNHVYANINYKERKPQTPAYDNSNNFGVKKLAPKTVGQTKQQIKYPSYKQQHKYYNKQGSQPVRDNRGGSSNQIITRNHVSTKDRFQNAGTLGNPIKIDNRTKVDVPRANLNTNGNRHQVRRVQQKRNQKNTNPSYDTNKNKPVVKRLEQNDKLKYEANKKNQRVFQNQKQYKRKQEQPNINQRNIINPKNGKSNNQSNSNRRNQYTNIEHNCYHQNQQYSNPYVNDYQHVDNTDFGIEGQDPQMQRVIMMSMGLSQKTSGLKQPEPMRGNKKTAKIDDFKPQQLDLMNESFYSKQRAIYQQFQKKKKK